MKKFILKTSKELIDKMKEDNFKGTYYIESDIVIWNISKEVFIEIVISNQPNEAYISYNYNISNRKKYVTHEHLELEYLYKYLTELNSETNILVIKKTIFGESAKIYFEKDTNFNETKFTSNHKYKIFKF